MIPVGCGGIGDGLVTGIQLLRSYFINRVAVDIVLIILAGGAIIAVVTIVLPPIEKEAVVEIL